MTEDEKFAQIQQSRQLANGGTQDKGSGVEAHPQADKSTTEQKPDGGKPKDGNDVKDTPKEPTEAEKQQHAIAEMRSRFKRENDSLKKEVESLRKWKADFEAKQAKPKTLEDFGGDAGKFGEYLRKQIEDEVYARVSSEFSRKAAEDAEMSERGDRLSKGLEALQSGLSQKVMAELKNPDSVMSGILNDEHGGKIIADAITESEHGAELLALMHSKPELFQQMLTLSPKRIEYRINQLEDQIVALSKQIADKNKAEAEKQAKSDSLPNVGAFGTNGNGNKGIGGLSAKERVERYKAEMRNL